MNPFRYGQVVSDQEFCPRPGMVRQLKAAIQSGQNVVLQGERRIGKTSLIHETVRRMKRYRMLYVDLLEIKTTEDLCKRMVNAIVSLERRTGFLENILQTISQLRPVLSIEPTTGQLSVTLDAGLKLQPDSIDGLLDLVVEIGKRKPLVVTFDEFQDILNLSEATESLAALRSKIQFHTNIPYLFAGSVRNQMSRIFTNPESPFFNSATTLEVGPLRESVFVKFLRAKFGSGGRVITKEAIMRAIEIAENIPGDIQELCSCIWEITMPDHKITEEDIGPALELIFSRESKGYEATLVQVTGQQLKCLTGLARMGGGSPFSADFLRGAGIPLPGSVKKALDRLVQLKIIYRFRREYRFVNPFFKSWLIWKNY